MKRLITAAVLLATFVVAVASPASANQQRGDQKCRYESPFRIVRCFAADRGIDGDHAVSTVDCESGGYPYAVNGKFKGLWQYSPSTWASWWAVVREWMKVKHPPNHYVRANEDSPWVGDRRMDPHASSATATYQIKHAGWSAWSCA